MISLYLNQKWQWGTFCFLFCHFLPNSTAGIFPVILFTWPLDRGGGTYVDVNRRRGEVGWWFMALFRAGLALKGKVATLFDQLIVRWGNWQILGQGKEVGAELVCALHLNFLVFTSLTKTRCFLNVFAFSSKISIPHILTMLTTVIASWNISTMAKYLKYPLAPIGILAPRLRTLTGGLIPPLAGVKIVWHTCSQVHLQTSPPTTSIFWDLDSRILVRAACVRCHRIKGVYAKRSYNILWK